MNKNSGKIKPLTKKDIKELSETKGENGPFFSFYLGIKTGVNFVSEANSVITNAAKKIEENSVYSKKEKKKILAAAQKMKNEVRFLKLPDRTRSIIVFRDSQNGKKFFHVPVYMPSRLVIENDFYIHPIIRTLEKYPRYLVVFLERDKARFFGIFLGEIEEVSEILYSNVPQRINAARAEWKGLEETKIQGHIEDHLHRHLKRAAKKTDDYFRYKKNGFSCLVVGSRKELMKKFTDILGVKSKEKLIGSYAVVPNYDLNRIKSKSMEVVDAYEKKKEAKTAETLFAGSSKKKASAVLGVNSVLENFYLHNVDTLVIGSSYKEAGYVCSKCHYISSYLKICPVCSGKMIRINDIADEILEEALLRKMKIRHMLYPSEKFDKFGIGAVLKVLT